MPQLSPCLYKGPRIWCLQLSLSTKLVGKVNSHTIPLSLAVSLLISPMPTILLRIFLLYNLLNSFLLNLVPKRLRLLLPHSWYPHQHQAHPPLIHEKALLPPPLLDPSSSSASCLGSHRRRMEPVELKRIFQMFDKNGDGRITKKELNDSLENLEIFIPDEELTQMIHKIDVNGDGCVDIDEFGALYQTLMDERDEEEDMREAFNVFDRNGDGFITVEELRSVLASLGLKQGRTIEECRRMIMKVDVDGDGMVNYKEFEQMMKGGGFSVLS